ncbi:MAG: type II secretion system protein [Vulcanimicrobiota bacterium]
MDGKIGSKRKRALTLLETIIAIGLLAMATLSLLTIIVSGMKMMQRSNEVAAASDVARSTLEAIKRDFKAHGMSALPPDEFTFDGRDPEPDEVDLSGPVAFPPQPYPRVTVGGQTYFVGIEGRSEGTRVKRVKVNIFWDDDTPLVLEALLHP